MNSAIGDVARRTRVKVPTIRYYEQIGLLQEPARGESGRRIYTETSVRRLLFIRHARELGFDVPAIRTLLALQEQPDQSCEAADNVARARLAEVKQRIAALTSLQGELERMIASCSHGRVDDCRVIEVLADHNLCLHESHAPEAEGPAV
jgi:DNA-binding transcriptional MerR regulator